MKIRQWQQIFKYFIVLILLFFINIQMGLAANNLMNAFSGEGSEEGVLEKTAGPGGAGYNTESATVETIIGQVLTIVLSFLGVIFLVLMVYGGYLWMTARGNEDQVKRAQNVITAAMTGVVIVILAYAISWFVISKLGGATLK